MKHLALLILLASLFIASGCAGRSPFGMDDEYGRNHWLRATGGSFNGTLEAQDMR